MLDLENDMDVAEKLVADHLAYRGYSDVVYEPDGNIPPDFGVGGEIAIEVRRLNQHEFGSDTPRGLEQVAIALHTKIRKLVEEVGAQTPGESWFVDWRFHRPVAHWKELGPILKSALKAFAANSERQKGIITKAEGIELEVFPASKAFPNTFVVGGYSDEESGGWLLAEMQVNIDHCVKEKTGKISKYRNKYPQWWLILVDHIGYGLDDFDRELFRDQVSIEHNWEKIILVNPNDHTRWFEI